MTARAFENQIAIVTGASSGIGKALAHALVKEGAKVVLSSRRRDALEACARALTQAGGDVDIVPADVTKREEVKALVDGTVAKHGRVDLMFNNAAYGLLADAHEMSSAQWDRIIATNLMGVVHGVEAAYPVMVRQRSGHIVNIASLAGLVPMPASAAYAATKFGVVGLSRSLRVEAAPHGVRVSVVCPAAVKTEVFTNAEYVNYDGAKLVEQLPGNVLTADACALAILRGVRRNTETIVPGPAAIAWRIERLVPSLWRMIANGTGKKLGQIRVAPTAKS